VVLFGESRDEINLLFSKFASHSPFLRKRLEFLSTGKPAGSEKKEHALRQGFFSSSSFEGFFAKLVDGMASEVDSLYRIHCRAIVEDEREAPHTHDGVIYFDLSDDFVPAEFPDGCQF
jgi:hypothetical protein